MAFLHYAGRLAALEDALRADGRASPHPWLTTFVGESATSPW